MRKLTLGEIREPRVQYVVPEGTVLPDEVRSYLEFCIGTPVKNSATGQRGTRYIIPGYMMREWLAIQD